MIERLRARYPDAACALAHRNAFELLVATILSAQCTDARVNLVTPVLFARYPDPAAMAAAPQEEVERIIRSTGFFRNKAKAIRAASQRLVDAYGGQVPRTMDELLTLPGAARKTSSVVLGVAYGVAEGVVVDTHVARVSRRLGLTRVGKAEEIEHDLMRVIPRESWIEFAHLLIFHGRQTCQARSPKCPECAVQDLCPSARYFLNGKLPPWEARRAEARRKVAKLKTKPARARKTRKAATKSARRASTRRRAARPAARRQAG